MKHGINIPMIGWFPWAHQISSELLTISIVGVLGIVFLIRLRSSLVTKLGVTGTHGVKGW
jgi:hypothetical protein